jgi:peptide/nickel transport system ATP-binding protein
VDVSLILKGTPMILQSEETRKTPTINLLEIQDLHTHFVLPGGVIRAVDGMDLEIAPGEVVAVVGESGSGKSVTALSAMRLLPKHVGRSVKGRVMFRGEDLLTYSARQMQNIRGRQIGMIFQNPYAALNPVIDIGIQLVETAKLDRELTRKDAFSLSCQLLDEMGIDDPERVVKLRPFQVSGGINQRVMLALALIGEPALLIADEPTTMLDSLTQGEILRLIDRVQRDSAMSVWLISHDFGVVSRMADKIVVMYMGQPVETASSTALLETPRHPYSIALRDCVPSMGTTTRRLSQVHGEAADPQNPPAGCRFAPRCPRVMKKCEQQTPPAFSLPDGTSVKCWLFE